MDIRRNRPRLLATAFAALTLQAISPAVLAEPQGFKIDDNHFSVVFEVDNLGYSAIIGMFLEGQGRFLYDPDTQELASGAVIIQSNSVFTNHEKRDEHLRNEDFLYSDRYPEITFTVTGFESTGENTGTLAGDLTMRGQTHPVSLDVTLNKAGKYPVSHEEYTLGISASTTIQRSVWGLSYALEPGMIDDKVDVRFELEAILDRSWRSETTVEHK